jgi:cbb3-type cytochrome oxidase subunit 3
MELIKEYFGSIEGVHIFAIISLLVLLTTFIVIVIHTYRIKKEKIKDYSRYPLEDDDISSN